MIGGGRLFDIGLAVVVVTASAWATQQEHEVKLTVLGGLAFLLLLWAQQNFLSGDNESVELALSVSNVPPHWTENCTNRPMPEL